MATYLQTEARARNERVRLLSNAFNNLATGLMLGAVVLPSSSAVGNLATPIWVVIAFGLYLLAHGTILLIVPED